MVQHGLSTDCYGRLEDGNKKITSLTEAPLVAKQREPVPPQAGGRG